MGANFVAPSRDPRWPDGVPMSAGYTPGVPRLGIPALCSSDASLGIANPGYRPDDKGATVLLASLKSWHRASIRSSPASVDS